MSKRVPLPLVATLLALAALAMLAVLTAWASAPLDVAAAPQATPALVPRAYLPFITKVLPLLMPNDPEYSQQWALTKVDAPHAWALSQGADVTVAVVDTGVDLTHPDLAGKIVPNSGYNFVDMNNNPQDDNGHGTHVAGIIGASTGNGIGVASIGWAARIVPIKVLDYNGSGWTSDVAAGINFAGNSSARIINLSLGSTFQDNTVQAAINSAWNKGKVITVAAGNCGDPSTYFLNGCVTPNPVIYPAAGDHVIAVGSTTNSDARSSFSSYGFWVAVSAPGSNIYSTLWPATYGYESGTSMASPMAAGLAALIWARNPSLTNAGVVNVLQASADDRGAAGWDPEFGYGRINAYRAVQMATTVAAQGAGPAQAAAVDVPPAMPTAGARVRPGVVLMRMKPAVQAAAAQADLAQRYNLQVAGQIGDLGVVELSVPAGSEYDTAVKLMADPAVEYAEPDYAVWALN